MSTLEFDILINKPSRSAGLAIRQHMIEQIIRQRAEPGTSLMPAEELADHFGVSRSTMNRVLDSLQREGWIERRVGQGTFIGYRAELSTSVPLKTLGGGKVSRIVRLAVAVLPLDHSPHNWMAQGLLNGIDAAASDSEVSVELLGQCNNDNNKFAKRLAQSQPDVLALLKPTIQSAPIIREAERLNIPCILTGARLRDIQIPTVYEDGFEATRMAVRYLAEKGHKQIGFLLPNEPYYLWLDRRKGYEAGINDVGFELDQNLIFWCDYPAIDEAARLEKYIQKRRPTAMILAEGQNITAFSPMLKAGKLRVPDDLSIVTFDQCFDFYKSVLGDIPPTYIELPVRQMTKWIVQAAKDMVAGNPPPLRTILPCRLVEGGTTAAPRQS